MIATIKAYLWVAPYIVIALLIAVISYYRYEMSEANAKAAITQTALDSALATNEQQTKTISALIELRQKGDEIVSELTNNIAIINQNVIDQNKAISDLKETDPDVKDFTSRTVPDSLKRLHNR